MPGIPSLGVMPDLTYWAPFLHLYQPPTQEPEVLKRINDECYGPLFDVIADHPSARVTLNVNAVLLDLLVNHGMEDTIDKIKWCLHNGRLEVVGTAKYHPLLPLIPAREIKRQIRLNENTFDEYLGDTGLRRGFFPPELAFSDRLFPLVHAAGFKWLILAGIACPGDWPYDQIQTHASGLAVVYRDDVVSNKISFNEIDAPGFLRKIKGMYDTKAYVITAQDGETFGHHIKHYERTFLARAFKLVAQDPDVRCAFVSDVIHEFPTTGPVSPRPSSWSTSTQDLEADVPYPLWKHPDNPVHRIQYKILKHVNRVVTLLHDTPVPPGADGEIRRFRETAQYFYDQGIHSCQFWWASMRPMWSPNLIVKGAEILVNSALNATLALIKLHEPRGEDLFEQISNNFALLCRELMIQTANRNSVRLLNGQADEEEEEGETEADAEEKKEAR